MSKIIPDIYHGDTVNAWKDIPSGCEFIILKASQGTGIDSKVIERIGKCKKYGVYFWIYVFLNKGNELTQTKFMVNQTKEAVEDAKDYFMGYCLDAEAENTVANLKKCVSYLDALECKKMLYVPYQYYSTYKSLIRSLDDDTWAFWEPRYGTEEGNKKGLNQSAKYPPHSECDLHQYTEYGSTSLIKNKCDLNRITGYGKDVIWFTTPLTAKQSYTGMMPELIAHTSYYISKGDTGEEVVNLQNFLAFATGNTELASDGVFGNLTEQAVNVFKALVGLEKDGIFDEKSYEAAKTFKK